MTQRNLRRTGFIIGLVLILLALLYAGLRVYSGQAIARQISDLAESAADRPGVTVNTLSYEPGLFNGELTVDLELQVLPDELAPMLPDPDRPLRIDGRARVTQGPTWSAANGMAWARAEFRGLSADAMTPWLPGMRSDYLLQGVLVAKSDDRLSATGTISAQDAPQEGTGTALAWAEGPFSFDLSGPTPLIRANLVLPTLAQHGPDGWQASGVRLAYTHNPENETTLEIDADTFRYAPTADTTGKLALDQPRLRLGTRPSDNDNLTHRLTVGSGTLQLPHTTLDATTLGLTLSNVSPGTLADLLNTATLAAVNGPTPESRRRLVQQLEALALSGAVLEISPAAVSLGAPENISGQARLGLSTTAGELPPDTLTSPLTMLQYADIELEGAITLGALRRITRLQAEAQARNLEANRGLERTEDQTRRIAASAYRSALLTLQFMPLVNVSDGQASVALALRDQVIYRNGERLMSLEQLLGMLTGR